MGGLFQFMRQTKNVRHKPEEEGIYLDDLNLADMDEKTAKLYFPKRYIVLPIYNLLSPQTEGDKHFWIYPG